MTRKFLPNITPEQAEAFTQLSTAAERGDGSAACKLGDMHREKTVGLRYSPKATFRWYARSALTKYPEGQNNLGVCFQHGVGCVQSYGKAVCWYRLAAVQGLGTASSNVGHCYLHGHGVPVDPAAACTWFEKALEQGNERAAEMVKKLRP